MEHLKIELLPTSSHSPQPSNIFYKKIIKTTFYILLFLLVGGAIFSYRIATSDTSLSKHENKISLAAQVKHFIGIGNDTLIGENDDRINILLLGIGGSGHEGPDLTDTIIVVSIKPSTEQVALISIPRDLIVWQEQFGWRKINHANAFGESIEPQYGGEFTSNIISQTFGIPIPYYIKIDFTGLVQTIDILGGLTIDVERSFTDYTYPTEDFYTKTISYTAGEQLMNGNEVLMFVRSRHGTNGEGSDFARARRQQLVLESFKDQAISFGILLHPNKINALLKTIESNVETNLQNWEIIRIAGMIRDLANNETLRVVLDDEPGGFLQSRLTEEGAYILTPKNDSFSNISYEIKYIFTSQVDRPSPVRVAIRNGTNAVGLAATTAKKLEQYNLFITQIANATKRDWQQTTIYKLSGKATQDELKRIQDVVGGIISIGLPNWLAVASHQNGNATTTPTIPPSDILIILGDNSAFGESL